MKFLKNSLGCVLAASLLIAAFPRWEFSLLAWVALVPFLLVIDNTSKRAAFAYGWLFGFLFFFGTTGWLMHVTLPGALLMAVYLGIYPALFAAGSRYFKELSLIKRVFILSCLWSALEYLRASLFTGFGWASIGHSQYKNLWLIQIADIVGLYGISFMVIFVNLFVFETLKAVIARKNEVFAELRWLQLIIVVMLSGSLVYGAWTFKKANFTTTVKVSVVQPNIPQEIKRVPKYMPSIVKETLRLTDQAAQTSPDLIVWPETSLPGILSENPSYVQQIQLKALDLKTPILMGAIRQDDNRYYNSAVLIGAQGTRIGHYDKMHLVPFGEFLPLRPILGWINKYIGLEDFTSGTEYVLFPAGTGKHPFGVLICFEDALYDLWRQFTQTGASFLVNITNDAWFMDTKEPFLHLQCAVFGSVMNKRSLVRSANTGVSSFIDPLGRIIDVAKDKKGKSTFVAAAATADIPVDTQITFHTKYADVFTYLCFACILAGVFIRRKYA